ncbi:MAG: Fe-S assembly protein IscX [Phototrophicales bacterium]|nr:MAG: Fe-S assembly protein IscX [Phototrophicales bacterium]
MSINPPANSLYWEATYAIARCLRETYPEMDVETVGFGQLLELVTALPGFADDPALANEAILNDILREWFEETHNE